MYGIRDNLLLTKPITRRLYIYIHVTNFIFSNYQQLSENIFKPVGEHTLLSSDWLYFT